MSLRAAPGLIVISPVPLFPAF